jgi:hypothetical protein
MKIFIACCAVALAAAMSSPSAVAKPKDDSAFQEWFEKTRRTSERLRSDLAVDVVWEETRLRLPEAAEVKAIAKRVAANPRSPERAELEEINRVTRGESKRRIRLLIHDGRWRVSIDDGEHKIDYGRDGDAAWQLTPHDLSISRAVGASPKIDYASMESSFVVDLSSLLTGGVGGVEIIPGEKKPPVLTGGAWTWQWSADPNRLPGREVILSGSWNSQLARGNVERTSIWMIEGNSRREAMRVVAKEWRTDPILEWICVRAVEYGDDGLADRELRLISFQSVDPLAVDAAAKVPALSGDDPLRGTLAYSTIADHRREGTIAQVKDGEVVDTRPLSEAPERVRYDNLERGGWILAGSIVVCLLLIRLRRASKAAV